MATQNALRSQAVTRTISETSSYVAIAYSYLHVTMHYPKGIPEEYHTPWHDTVTQ